MSDISLWIKVEDGLYAKSPSPDPAKVVTAEQLISEKSGIEARLLELPEMPTDEELLAWAREHYPFHDTSVERASLSTRLEEINSILSL